MRPALRRLVRNRSAQSLRAGKEPWSPPRTRIRVAGRGARSRSTRSPAGRKPDEPQCPPRERQQDPPHNHGSRSEHGQAPHQARPAAANGSPDHLAACPAYVPMRGATTSALAWPTHHCSAASRSSGNSSPTALPTQRPGPQAQQSTRHAQPAPPATARTKDHQEVENTTDTSRNYLPAGGSPSTDR